MKILIINFFKEKFILPTIFVLFGSIWAISTPISSSADDDYHLTSIWCNSLNDRYCTQINQETVLVPAELNTDLIPEKYTGWPPCYVTWPKSLDSAQCLELIGNEKGVSQRFSSGYEAKLFYKVMSFFVSSDVETSVFKMRIFNVFLAGALLWFALFSAPGFVSKGLKLSWVTTIVPVQIFYIASTNPSSWSISGLCTFWVYPIIFIDKLYMKHKIGFTPIVGAVLSTISAMSSRSDSIIYLFLMLIGIFLYKYKTIKLVCEQKFTSKYKFLSIVFVSTSLFMFGAIKVITDIIINLFNRDFSKESPNPLINILIETPSFLVALLGGQEPRWIQFRGELGRDFTYGVGWLEFDLPSVVGIFNLTAVILVLGISFSRVSEWSRICGTVFLFGSLPLIIIYVRARSGFLEGQYFQPRYLAPYLTAIIGISIALFSKDEIKIPKFIKALLMPLIYVSGTISFQSIMARYVMGFDSAFTNLQWPINWSSKLWKDWVFEIRFAASALSFIWTYISVKEIKSEK
jgi:hypothetical protein